MANKFASIAFTANVQAAQARHGSRQQYARIEKLEQAAGLTEAEAEFISERDGFYLATVGENGYPYVQFRGGAKGFLKVLDANTLGYADFRGNRQYISVGNLAGNDRAALILMDYANRQRLKIFARIEVLEAQAAPELIAGLVDPTYQAHVERIMLLHVEAFNWNCRQHITPRYTAEEIQVLNAPLYEQIATLEQEVARLKQAL